MADFTKITVDGLDEVRKSFKKIDSNLGKEIRKSLNKGAQIVVDHTPQWVPKKTGRAARSIRASSTQKEARVSEGGATVPYMGWLDFGGKRPRDKVGRQFRRHGRFIWVTFGKRREEIEDELSNALADLARSAGLEVT